MLRRAVQTGEPQVSGLVAARNGGYQTQVLVPVDDRLLLVAIDADAWLEFISQYAIDPDAAMTLVDQHRRHHRALAGRRALGGQAAGAAGGPEIGRDAEGAYRGEGPEGQAYYGAHSRSARWGWTVAAASRRR